MTALSTDPDLIATAREILADILDSDINFLDVAENEAVEELSEEEVIQVWQLVNGAYIEFTIPGEGKD